MVKGIGIDLVENDRVKSLFAKHGNSFAKKILSKDELLEFKISDNQINYLSKHFASKEALSKAFGIGLYRHKLYPSSITIKHDKMGKPYFYITGVLENMLLKISATELFLSITDTNKHSIAMVVVE